MLTLDQIRRKAKESGAPITQATFWRLVEAGLLPQGERHPGLGNVFYFPDDTADRIASIQTLRKKLGVPVKVIQKFHFYLFEDQPWDETVVRKQPSAVELILWWTGIMTRLRLLDKPKLERRDFHALFPRVKQMFEAFEVNEQGRE